MFDQILKMHFKKNCLYILLKKQNFDLQFMEMKSVLLRHSNISHTMYAILKQLSIVYGT